MGLIDRLFKSQIDARTSEQVAQQVHEVEERMAEVSDQKALEKAQELHATWVDELRKAEKIDPADAEAKSLLSDPFQLLETMRYKERPMMVTYDVLRAMSERDPIIAAVINTRVNQIASFATPPKSAYDIGFHVTMTDDETDPTPEDEKRIRDLELFVENTGHPSLPSEDRDSFDQFLRKITRDSLTYDQMTFEVVNGRGQFPIAFLAVDAATIRLATTPKYFKDVTKTKIWGPPSQVEIEGWRGTSQPNPVNPEDVRYVQVLDGRVVTTYTEEEMGFAIRNPRTYIRLNGYGVSELELLINTVTAHLWSEEYNRRFFSQGSAPKGIIHFEGNISQEQLTAFRRQWHAQIMGVYNAWRTPIIAAPAKLQYTNLQVSNKQMEYAQWMDYLIKLICAVYLIDPTEIGFDMRGGATTGQTPMFETHHEQRQKMSKDRGLRPLLRFVQNEINKNIIYRLYDGRYKFEFVGLDAKTEEQLQEMRLKEVQNFKTIDEVRAEFDLPPLGPEKAGDIIMNSAYLNYLNQLQMQKMQQQPPMGGGGGGDFGQEDSGEEQPDFGQEQDFGGGQ